MSDRYLFRRGGRWYARVAVPSDVRPYLAPTANGKPPYAIVKALGTAEKREAVNRLPAVVAAIKDTFDRAREQSPLSDEEIDRLAAQYMAKRYEAGRLSASRDPERFREGAGFILESFITPTDDGDVVIPSEDHHREALRLIREGGARDTSERLAEALCRAEMRALRVLLEDRELPPRPPGVRTAPPSGSVTFADAVARYVVDRMRDPAAAWSVKAKWQIETTLRLFGSHIGEGASLAGIGREDAAGFLDALGKLNPVYARSPRSPGKTLAELTTLFPGPPFLANATLNRHGSALSGLFKWAINAGLIAGPNPFADQSRDIGRGDRRGYEQFEPAELQALVRSIPSTGVLRWLPLVAMFSGMRSGEILGLRSADIRERDGIAYFDVRESEGRSIKSAAARRIVPVHSTLIRLGFLDRGASELIGSGIRSSDFSRTFARHLQRQGIKRPRLSMHSLRGNVATALENAGVSESDAATLLGHEKATLSYGLYSSGLTLARLRDVVEAISYPGLEV